MRERLGDQAGFARPFAAGDLVDEDRDEWFARAGERATEEVERQ